MRPALAGRRCAPGCTLGQRWPGWSPTLAARWATSTLQPWGHWVTPVGLPKRFDTLFFVARAPAGQVPEVDAGETTALAWVQPAAALDGQAGGAFALEFATRSTLESLRPFSSVAAVLAHAAAQPRLPPLHPRLTLDAQGRISGVLLPGQAGYGQAPDQLGLLGLLGGGVAKVVALGR